MQKTLLNFLKLNFENCSDFFCFKLDISNGFK
jgi:hypothetical protein